MPLITTGELTSLTDKMDRIYEEVCHLTSPTVNLSDNSGDMQSEANAALAVVTGSNDYDVETDINGGAHTFATQINAASLLSNAFQSLLSSIQQHVMRLPPNASVSDLDTWLTFLNNPTAVLQGWATLIGPWFQDWWTFANGTALTAENIEAKPIHPSWRATAYVNASAMGNRAVGGAFSAGYTANAAYGSVIPVVEVTTSFASGSAPPTVTVTGVDWQGNSQTFTATVTGGNNPAATIATTITPAVNIMSRQTVAVGSLAGIVAGSVLVVNAGLVDQEVILVEAINSGATTITAVFRIAHTAGAALTGQRSFALTPGGAVGRIRSVSNIVIGITGQSAGTVRVTGVPDRISV